MPDPRKDVASGRALGPSSTPLPSSSGLARSAIQAVFEVGPGGRLPDSFRERPAGGDRPWPPSRREVIAALAGCGSAVRGRCVAVRLRLRRARDERGELR